MSERALASMNSLERVGPEVDLGEDLGLPDAGDGQALVADEPRAFELHRVRARA